MGTVTEVRYRIIHDITVGNIGEDISVYQIAKDAVSIYNFTKHVISWWPLKSFLLNTLPYLEKVIGDDDSQLQADCNHEGMIYNEYTKTWSWF